MIPERATAPILFAVAAILWGLSAIVSKDQALAGSPAFSVGIRMAIVSVVMFGYCWARGIDFHFPVQAWMGIVAQGLLFFSAGFILFYHSTTYVPSGVSALLLSLSAVIAAIIGTIFFSHAVSGRKIAGILTTIGGLAVLFQPELSQTITSSLSGKGMIIGCFAALATGIGTLFGAQNQAKGVPVPVCMAWGAAVGAVFSLAIWFAMPAPSSLVFSLSYFLGLLYLSLFASCVAFFLYFNLVQKIGPGSAASILATVPLIAVIVSVLFENLVLDWHVLIGGIIILTGNLLVLVERKRSAPAAS